MLTKLGDERRVAESELHRPERVNLGLETAILHDRDSKFSRAFDEVFRSEGVQIHGLAHTSPIRTRQTNSTDATDSGGLIHEYARAA